LPAGLTRLKTEIVRTTDRDLPRSFLHGADRLHRFGGSGQRIIRAPTDLRRGTDIRAIRPAAARPRSRDRAAPQNIAALR
jgi:hypothetical protein